MFVCFSKLYGWGNTSTFMWSALVFIGVTYTIVLFTFVGVLWQCVGVASGLLFYI